MNKLEVAVIKHPTQANLDALQTPETEFAKGSAIENQNIRVTYQCLNKMEPHKRFPTIYKTWGDGSISSVSLTPAEAQFLAQVLEKMFQAVKGT